MRLRRGRARAAARTRRSSCSARPRGRASRPTQLEKALLEQVEAAKTALPTDEEMQAAKNQLEAYFIFQNDSVSDQGEQLGYYNTVASWRYLDTLFPKIKAVTAQQVQDVAKKYLNEDNLTSGRFIPTNGRGAAARGEARGRGAGPCIAQRDRGFYRRSANSAATKARGRSPAADPRATVAGGQGRAALPRGAAQRHGRDRAGEPLEPDCRDLGQPQGWGLLRPARAKTAPPRLSRR